VRMAIKRLMPTAVWRTPAALQPVAGKGRRR
jgi:hypothetical protein